MNNLSITQIAKDRILVMCEERRVQTGVGVIPAIMWSDTGLNRHLAQSGICIGFYNEDQREELKRDLVIFEGLEHILAVSEADKERFLNKILDFRNQRF